MGPVVLGADIGQRVDPTAVAVAEAEWRDRPDGRPEVHFAIRHLERLPIGTGYPAIAERVAAIAAAVAERGAGVPVLYLDATGVGQPVIDVLAAAGVRARLVPVYFTHGDRRVVKEDRSISLGKAWLVSRLQALLQAGRIHLPRTAEAEVLATELLDYEIKVDQNANDTYGAFKVGTHDDLVTALGLAVQDEPRLFTCAAGGHRRPLEPTPDRTRRPVLERPGPGPYPMDRAPWEPRWREGGEW